MLKNILYLRSQSIEAPPLPLNRICTEQIRTKIILASGQPINEPPIEEVIPSKHMPTKFEATSRDLPDRSKGSASHLRVLPRCSEASASHPRALHGRWVLVLRLSTSDVLRVRFKISGDSFFVMVHPLHFGSNDMLSQSKVICEVVRVIFLGLFSDLCFAGKHYCRPIF